MTTRPREEWRQDIGKRYRALEQHTKEEARLQFLRILRGLPYGTLLYVYFIYAAVLNGVEVFTKFDKPQTNAVYEGIFVLQWSF